MTDLVKTITGSGRTLAKIIDLNADITDALGAGAHWFTDPEESLQFGILGHPTGYVVKPHTHGHPTRMITDVVEILVIVGGVYELTIFDEDRQPVHTEDVVSGTIVMLCAGGHGLKCKKKGVIMETRQGPHLGVSDKTYY